LEGDRLSASTSKKVLIQRFDRDPLPGFVNPRSGFQPSGVEIITTAGTVVVVPYADIKLVCFVKEFEPGARVLERRAFQNRPKMSGLWLRMVFRDGDILEGLHPNNLLQLEPFGFTVTPPDASANEQRVFVPREALREIQALGVVGSPLRPVRPAKPKKKRKEQLEMFDQE
jgi:hypothetical protein